MGDGVHYVENKMGECTETINGLVDAYEENKADNAWIKEKLADLEDPGIICQPRSKHNNIKLRGVPESVPHDNLLPYAHNLMSAILPEASR